MAAYTALDLENIEQILLLYGFKLDKERPIDAMLRGISNSNFSLFSENGDKLLLKISNDKNQKQLSAEFEILNTLKKKSFPYSITPLRTLEGELVYQYGNFAGALFPFKEGYTPDKTKNDLFELGKSLGSLHSLETQKQNLRSYFDIGQGVREILFYIKSPNNEDEFRDKVSQIFTLEELESLCEPEFPSGIIHGDFYYDNALFLNEKLQWMLDFEQAGHGPYILDLGIAISGSCLNSSNEIDIKLVEAYLEGYQSKRELTDLEQKHLNHFILIGFISISLWRIIRFNQKQNTKDRSNSYKELLNMAIRAKEILCN